MITNPPDEIRHVSRSQFSVARYYGGCTYQGVSYAYERARDVLIRRDVLAGRVRVTKAEAKKKREADKADASDAQGDLI
jgi:hypothetical protein